jgi:hypothetical protein
VRAPADAAAAEALRARADAAAAEALRAPADVASAEALRARIASIESRVGEVDRDVRMRILRKRSELLRGGVPVETYRRISLDEALGLLHPRTPAVAS